MTDWKPRYVTALIFLEEDDDGNRKWVCQCREINILSTGDTIEDAKSYFWQVAVAEMAVCRRKGKDFFSIDPPPPKVFEMRPDQPHVWWEILLPDIKTTIDPFLKNPQNEHLFEETNASYSTSEGEDQ